MERRPEDSPPREEQLQQALQYARDLLSDYQERHEAAERAWAQTCQRLEERAAFAEAQLQAFAAFRLPGAEEVLQLSRRAAAVRSPEPLDREAFTARLEDILG